MHGRAHHPHYRADSKTPEALPRQTLVRAYFRLALPCESYAPPCQLKLALPMQTRGHSWVRTTMRVICTPVPTQACTTNADQGAFLGRTTVRVIGTPMPKGRQDSGDHARSCTLDALPCAIRFSRTHYHAPTTHSRAPTTHSRALLVGHSESSENGPH